jgi:hypothetical protein
MYCCEMMLPVSMYVIPKIPKIKICSHEHFRTNDKWYILCCLSIEKVHLENLSIHHNAGTLETKEKISTHYAIQYHQTKKVYLGLGMVVHYCNSSTREAEAEELWIWCLDYTARPCLKKKKSSFRTSNSEAVCSIGKSMDSTVKWGLDLNSAIYLHYKFLSLFSENGDLLLNQCCEK